MAEDQDTHHMVPGAELGAAEARIIEAARSCFDTIGVNETKMGDIATAAGFSRQTLYKHFSSKEDIINRIGFLEIEKVNKTLRGRVNRNQSFADRLTDAITISVEISLENPYLRRVIENSQLMPRPREGDMSLFIWQRARWSRMLEEAQLRGELAADLDLDHIVEWILFAQLGLLSALDRWLLLSTDTKSFVRRFVVSPLISAAPATAEGETVFRFDRMAAENRMLKSLVASQALEIQRLRHKTSD